MDETLKRAFASHPRRWRTLHYVYPVIARRSRGLSIGINLSPTGACTFDCAYCSIDRSAATSASDVLPDLNILNVELRELLAHHEELFEEPEFCAVPLAYRRLNDLAFSGDGEPTASPVFPDAVRVVAAARADFGLTDVKIVLITNASCLTRPAVVEALRVLDANNGEIWAKLDAGTQEYFERINGVRLPLAMILDNILATARIRPIVLQSMFVRLGGRPPDPDEINAYVERVRWLLARGAQIALVQVYTLARRAVHADVSPLAPPELETIAAAVRSLGVPAEVFP
jgi:wyosine [tRNA(Phe)-imidazoG37] synthetase (radical SAM superfamily)